MNYAYAVVLLPVVWLLVKVKLFRYAAGVYACFLAYGLLVEQNERARYGPLGETFHFWTFVTCLSGLINVVVAYAALRMSRTHAEAMDVPFTQSRFAWVAVAQSMASASALTALDYVDFPTQTLGKCAKPISVLLGGLFFPGTKYTLKKAVTAVLVCIGISVFFLGKSKTTESQVSMLGVALIFSSLFFDGLVGGLQGSMRGASSGGKRASPYQMMFFINFWSFLITLAFTVVNGQLMGAVAFLTRFPSAFAIVLGLNFAMAFGQLFIYLLVMEFDPLVCSLTTTTRKFFSILASVIIYGHPVNFWQWVGIALVFAGLLLPEVQGIVQRLSGRGGGGNQKRH